MGIEPAVNRGTSLSGTERRGEHARRKDEIIHRSWELLFEYQVKRVEDVLFSSYPKA